MRYPRKGDSGGRWSEFNRLPARVAGHSGVIIAFDVKLVLTRQLTQTGGQRVKDARSVEYSWVVRPIDDLGDRGDIQRFTLMILRLCKLLGVYSRLTCRQRQYGMADLRLAGNRVAYNFTVEWEKKTSASLF